MSFHHHVLDNGMHIIGENNPAARSVSIGFFVNVGSRDETPEISGTSHFLEHMVFKGTPRRSAFEVNRDFDRIGAAYNAHTSEELTVFYAAVLPEYLPETVDLLTDILRPSLREDDFKMEKQVILEEIKMYEDRPIWCAYDAARKSFFGDHPLGNSILGSTSSIRKLKRDQMLEYFEHRYLAGNITAVVTGQFAWPRVVKLIEKACSEWPRGKTPRRDTTEAVPHAVTKVMCKKLAQENVFLVAPAPPAKSPLRYAADVLCMIAGEDSGSRLHWALVDPGHVESADIGYHEHQGAGMFIGSLTGEPDRTSANLQIFCDVLKRIEQDGVTDEEIAQAQSKILSRLVRSGERSMGRMDALGSAWIYLGKYRSIDDELAAYEAVNRRKIRQLLERYPLGQWTVVALGPLRKIDRPD